MNKDNNFIFAIPNPDSLIQGVFFLKKNNNNYYDLHCYIPLKQGFLDTENNTVFIIKDIILSKSLYESIDIKLYLGRDSLYIFKNIYIYKFQYYEIDKSIIDNDDIFTDDILWDEVIISSLVDDNKFQNNRSLYYKLTKIYNLQNDIIIFFQNNAKKYKEKSIIGKTTEMIASVFQTDDKQIEKEKTIIINSLKYFNFIENIYKIDNLINYSFYNNNDIFIINFMLCENFNDNISIDSLKHLKIDNNKKNDSDITIDNIDLLFIDNYLPLKQNKISGNLLLSLYFPLSNNHIQIYYYLHMTGILFHMSISTDYIYCIDIINKNIIKFKNININDEELIPEIIPSKHIKGNFLKLSVCKTHCLLLTSEGIYGWGENRDNQLLQNTDNKEYLYINKPTLISKTFNIPFLYKDKTDTKVINHKFEFSYRDVKAYCYLDYIKNKYQSSSYFIISDHTIQAAGYITTTIEKNKLDNKISEQVPVIYDNYLISNFINQFLQDKYNQIFYLDPTLQSSKQYCIYLKNIIKKHSEKILTSIPIDFIEFNYEYIIEDIRELIEEDENFISVKNMLVFKISLENILSYSYNNISKEFKEELKKLEQMDSQDCTIELEAQYTIVRNLLIEQKRIKDNINSFIFNEIDNFLSDDERIK